MIGEVPITMSTSPRAALYARVSIVARGQDVGLQLDELRQVAAQRGWQTSGVFIDDGVSGVLEARPALDKMLAEVRLGKHDLVVVWKLDRLGRSLQHVLTIIDTLNANGVGFVSLRDAGLDSTSASGRLMLQILASFAEYERNVIQERVRAGVARAKAAGKHCGRPRRDLDLRPAVALLKEGRGLREVAEILGVSRSSLRRRLQEAGAWPTEPVATADAA